MATITSAAAVAITGPMRAARTFRGERCLDRPRGLALVDRPDSTSCDTNRPGNYV